MSVSTMLEGKPKSIITASPDDTVADATQLLAKHRIGAVIVCDKGGKVRGILSERDIVRDIAHDGAAILENSISSCMTKNVLSCKRDDSIDSVMEIMTEKHFRHMPVTEGGKLVGVISIGDVVKCKIEQAEKDAQELMNYIAS
ncbi:MAG: CBS domain-containing protein [Rhizobiaceae bacterium]|nr:CBS domain-containing protein [Rhizobiaceae bacterium]